ncbi:MAG: SDR family oxidoreductase [Thermoleophilaceae bacterium]|jgi:3-oxoacyl-[acyl-carrier protein] reductase|nr:SDR family oxidoreductase [Thermoleophilaceae bacterium]
MDLGLTGRVALVTGASKGIGRAIAAALADEEAGVAIASRSRENIDAAAAEIGATGFAWDSADLGGAANLVAEVESSLGGPVDVLVCNTGGPPPGADPLGFSTDEWEAAHRSLVLSPIALVRAVLPGMRERGWGRILNVASSAVREPIPHLMLSNAERSATVAAFKTLAREAAGDGVTLNTVLPGRILTDRLISMGGSEEAVRDAAARDVPAKRPGTVEELAAVAAFLCSERASYVTGTAVAVDGGLLRGI